MKKKKISRRKRSHLTEADCLQALAAFAARVKRQKESSESFFHGGECLSQDEITVTFLVAGEFGVAHDLFEAVRVLAGHKLPAKGKNKT